jgi:apolipoprotein N-acyltransferase
MAAVAVGTDGVAVAEAVGPRGSRRALLAAAGGLMLAAAFPSLELAPLAWIGFVPILLAARGLGVRGAFAIGWFGGFVFFMATVYWVATTIVAYTSVPFPLAVGILVLMNAVLAIYHGVFVAGLTWLEARRVPAIWVAPALWVMLEWLPRVVRHRLRVGRPRVLAVPLPRPRADVRGHRRLRRVGAARALQRRGGRGRRRAGTPGPPAGPRARRDERPRRGSAAGRPVAGRVDRARPPAGSLQVALVQGNVEQDHKWDPGLPERDDHAVPRAVRRRRRRAPGADRLAGDRDAVLFQEPGPWRDDVLELAGDTRAFLLFGSPAYRRLREGGFEEFNRAYLVSPDGRELDSYDKIELVPFGEYVPFRQVLFFVDQIVHAIGRVVPGVVPTVFSIPGAALRRAHLLRGHLPRAHAAGSSPTAPTSWSTSRTTPGTGRTSRAAAAPRARDVSARWRTACRWFAPPTRASPPVIAPDGRIAWEGPLFEPLWRVQRIEWPGVRTFYAEHGDVFVYACVLASLAAFGYGAWRGAGRLDGDSGAA